MDDASIDRMDYFHRRNLVLHYAERGCNFLILSVLGGLGEVIYLINFANYQHVGSEAFCTRLDHGLDTVPSLCDIETDIILTGSTALKSWLH